MFTCVSTKGDRVCPNVVVLALLLSLGTKPFLPGNLPVPIPVHPHVEKLHLKVSINWAISVLVI